MEKTRKKERNYAVEFWRFIFTLGVAMSHFQRLGIARTADLAGVQTLFQTGRFINFFMIVTGYFMMDGFQRKKAKNDPSLQNPSKAAWDYIKGRYKALYPAFFVGTVFGGILACISNPEITSLGDAIVWFGSKIYVLLGLEVTGITGSVGAMNGALWYVSAIFTVSLPLYYLLVKNEQSYKIIAPCAFMVIVGYFGLDTERLGMMGMWSKNVLSMGIFETSWFVSFAWFCFGSMLWYPIEVLKKAELTPLQQTILNVLEVVLVVLLLKAVIVVSFYRDETLTFFYNAVFFAIIMSGKGPVNNFLGKIKANKFLGKFSLYMYVVHMPLVSFLPYLFGAQMNASTYYMWLAIFAACVIGCGFVAMFLTEKVVKPCIDALLIKNTNQEA